MTGRFFGPDVYYRGIVEFSNVCANDCGYCGIRKHMPGLRRYTIPIPEVLEVARWAFENKMGTLMLQVRGRARCEGTRVHAIGGRAHAAGVAWERARVRARACE